MNFKQSVTYLYSLGNEVETMKLGLDNIRKLLEALGNPQDNYLKVQVAGTNGKGSVCAFSDAICISAGIRTGLYISPHLISITERIKIGGTEISEEDFASHATKVREISEKLLDEGKLEYRPTFFEQVTAIALNVFADEKVELAILETGLGGRFDATTAANAEIAAITPIDLDHQEYLGDTIEEIAAEKAAIIHSATTALIVADQPAQAIKPIVEQACRIGIAITSTEFPETISEFGRLVFIDDSKVYDVGSLALIGRHQMVNAWTAILLANCLRNHFPISDHNIESGLENARHPGRLEYQGKFLFDGAHNVGGANALAEYVREFETRKITLIFGAMSDKNVLEILKILAPVAERIIITESSNSRSFSYAELLEQFPTDMSKERTFVTDNVRSAIDIAMRVTPDDGIILVTGSLYLVGEAKKIMQNDSET